MHKKGYLPHKSRFFLLSFRYYLLALLLPLLILVCMLVIAIGILLFQRQHTGIQERLSVLRGTVTEALNTSHQIGSNLANKRSVIPVLLAGNSEMQYELTRQLDSYRASNALYSDVIAYYPQVSYNLYTSRGSIDIEQLSPFFQLESDIDTYAAILDTIKSPTLLASSFGAHSIATQTANYFDGDDLLYITPVMLSTGNSRYLTLLTVIDKARLAYLTRQEMASWTGTVLMLNAGGRAVFSFGDRSPDMPKDENWAEISNGAEWGGYTIFYEGTLGDPVRFVYVAHTSALRMQVLESLYPITLCAVFAIFVGLLICLFFSFRAYWPIIRLDRLLSDGNSPQLMREGENEQLGMFSQIILDENGTIRQQLAQLTATMQVALVRQIIDGEITDKADIERLVSDAKIELPGPFYMALYVRLGRSIDEAGRFELALSLHREINWPYGIVPITMTIDEPSLMLVASLPAGLGSEHFQDLLLSSVHAVLANYDIEASIGVSRIKQDVAGLRDAYLEAQAALRNDGLRNVDDRRVDIVAGTEPDAMRKLLLSAEKHLQEGNPLPALEDIRIWFDQLSEMAEDGVQRYIVHMLDTVFEALIEQGYLQPSLAATLLSRCILFHTIDEVEAELAGIIETLSARKPVDEPADESELADRMAAYIDQSAYDPLFSMTMMAEAFGIPVFAFSRIFKRYFGRTFIDYVSQRRIDRAKALLSGTDMKLKDIVEMIGYVDVSNFIRKFKMTVGMTPGEYRKQSKDS